VIARDDGVGHDHRVIRATADPDSLARLERERLASERDPEVAHSPAFLRGLPNAKRPRGGRSDARAPDNIVRRRRWLRLPTTRRWFDHDA
jgi:hypothetical protein